MHCFRLYPGDFSPIRNPGGEETDVNIAINMLNDAYQDRCERFVLESGRSDLVPVLNMVRDLFPQKEIIVYVPARDITRSAATELRWPPIGQRPFPKTSLPTPISLPTFQTAMVGS